MTIEKKMKKWKVTLTCYLLLVACCLLKQVVSWMGFDPLRGLYLVPFKYHPVMGWPIFRKKSQWINIATTFDRWCFSVIWKKIHLCNPIILNKQMGMSPCHMRQLPVLSVFSLIFIFQTWKDRNKYLKP